MAKVLQNFLIGVGLDTDDFDKGAKRVEGGLDRMRTLVTFTGTALVGAFGGAATAAIASAKRIDEANLATEGFKTSTAYIVAYGHALRNLGGDATEALAAIRTLEEGIMARRYTEGGEMPGESELALAGIDIHALRDTHSGDEMLRELARQMPGLNQEQQLSVERTLGFSPAVMESLRHGTDNLDAAIERQRELYGEFGRATEAAREYRSTLADVNTQLESIGETMAEKMLPAFTGVLQSTSDFIQKNRNQINAAIGAGVENPASTAAIASGAALAAPWAWRAARAVGLRAIPYAGLAYGAYEGLKDEPVRDWWDQSVDSARDSWRGITGQDDVSHLLDAPYGSAVPDVAPGSIVPRTQGEFMPLDQTNYHDGYRPAPIVESPTSGFVTPYDSIYGGGEVSNSEAAAYSPEVIMIREQARQQEAPAKTPRVDVKNHLDVRLEMDGYQFETKITDVVEQRERKLIEDFSSTEDR